MRRPSVTKPSIVFEVLFHTKRGRPAKSCQGVLHPVSHEKPRRRRAAAKSEVRNRVVQSQGVGVGDGAEKLASSPLQGQAAGDVSRAACSARALGTLTGLWACEASQAGEPQ
ncbi:uncharacterized protein VDAG_05216 [Verticillium dahliae VdLs.17]|uniref:Uncharacterized protein n=1 Tax=Verticillium dahliae (strain VdLs.17 / ATCC MYA-4575 / FGSC 10137) TaxID=498257 RepID=G2X4Y4_VERDV|nr:uncharacterized protein VDAG_05216 [Verticillium dahliae VdLs.17]EGY23778.1 hypothetical protein VDAG_05216 [Verticillium dahliae VdLs.17]